MKRSLFFLIAAILATLLGALMFLAPSIAAQSFGLADSPDIEVVFRILGATLLSLAVMNFLVRNHRASETLKAVLWTNIATHGIGAVADIWSTVVGPLPLSGVIPGLVIHAFVGIGSVIYLMRMEPAR